MTAIVPSGDNEMARPLPAGMAALTLWQPWGSLIAEGVKTIETRSWKAPESLIGDTIAIHAAAKRPPDTWANESPSAPWLDLDAMVKHYAIDEASDVPGMFRYRWAGPLGAVVATARLVDCVPVPGLMADGDVSETMWADDRDLIDGEDWHFTGLVWWLHERQRPYGDFSDCRWAWLLDEVTPTNVLCPWCGSFVADCLVCDGAGSCDPIPAKGRQRLWRWSP